MLAKALAAPPQTKRLTLRNLTVYYLDLLRCIVFKDRFAFVLSLNAGFIITKHPLFVKLFSIFLKKSFLHIILYLI